jgi:hypothetical protein
MKIHVYCDAKNGNWGKSFVLKESLGLQRLNFPRQQLRYISLQVENAIAGPDDDLCISDIVLYYRGKPLKWHMAPTVLYNEDTGCCCTGGPYYSLRTVTGKPVCHHGKPVTGLNGKARLPGSGITLLGADHMVYVYDFVRSRFIAERNLLGRIRMIGWQDGNNALVQVSARQNVTRWYRFALSSMHWMAVSRVRNSQLLASDQPNYGEGE